MKCEIKSIIILYLVISNVGFSASLNKIPETSNFMTKLIQNEEQKDAVTNLKFNYSLLIAILSVCIGFLLSALWLLFALIYHK